MSDKCDRCDRPARHAIQVPVSPTETAYLAACKKHWPILRGIVERLTGGMVSACLGPCCADTPETAAL